LLASKYATTTIAPLPIITADSIPNALVQYSERAGKDYRPRGVRSRAPAFVNRLNGRLQRRASCPIRFDQPDRYRR
jgi:hypothetical protein